MSNNRKRIVVVGSINMDLVATAEHIPSVGETITGNSFATHAGGKGANQAVAIGRLGYPVSMIGKVGSDAFGEQLRQSLMSAGVDCAAVDTVSGSSGVAVILVSSRGENCIVVTPEANNRMTPDDIDARIDIIRTGGLVLAQLEIPIETVGRLAEICEREGIPLMLDPAPARPLSSELLRRVAWLTPNETEAEFYLASLNRAHGERSNGMITSLIAAGPAAVVLKLGEHGVRVSVKDGVEQRIAAIPVNAIDTTAAGDAFNGAFAVALMSGKNSVESARFAVAAAASSVTRRGAQESMPTLRQVEELLQESATIAVLQR